MSVVCLKFNEENVLTHLSVLCYKHVLIYWVWPSCAFNLQFIKINVRCHE